VRKIVITGAFETSPPFEPCRKPHLHRPEKIPLAERHPEQAQDGVRRFGVEGEVREREGEQKVPVREVELDLDEFERRRFVRKPLDLRRIERSQFAARLGDERLKAVVVLVEFEGGRVSWGLERLASRTMNVVRRKRPGSGRKSYLREGVP